MPIIFCRQIANDSLCCIAILLYFWSGHITRSKQKWVFLFCEKYDQIKGTLKYTILPSKTKLVNFFLCLYYKENQAYSSYVIVFFTKWKKPMLVWDALYAWYWYWRLKTGMHNYTFLAPLNIFLIEQTEKKTRSLLLN
jgi:hypothetical protein